MPLVKPGLEIQALHRNPDLRAPSVRTAGRRGLPNTVPLSDIALPIRVDEAVVLGTARVDGKHVPGSSIKKWPEYDADVILGGEGRIAPITETDDAARFRILADDADHQRLGPREHPDDRAACRRSTLVGFG